MKLTKPDLSIPKALGGGMVALGFLLFLVGLHLLTINTTGDTATVLRWVFIPMLWVYVGLLFMGIITVLYLILYWLVWFVSVPNYKKKR